MDQPGRSPQKSKRAAFSSNLAGFAVDDRDIVLVLLQPLLHVVAERLDELDLGRVVVVERVVGDPVVKFGCVVVAF